MKRKTIFWKDLGVTAQFSIFGENQSMEMHVIFHVESRSELFSGQYARIQDAYSLFLIVRYHENAGEWGPQGPHHFPGAARKLLGSRHNVSAPADSPLRTL